MDRTSDDYLLEATIGPRVRLDGPVLLAPYDPGWPGEFERLARAIRGTLGARVLLLEHVGSTSVPGLAAKPVIDMVLAVSDSADEPAYVPRLEAAGFAMRIREPAWFQHRMLKTPGRDGNLHVFTVGCLEIERMIAFRDRLRADERDHRLYEETKRALAARTWGDVQHYADAKADVVEEILGRARGTRAGVPGSIGA